MSSWYLISFDGQKLFDTSSYQLNILAKFKKFESIFDIVSFIIHNQQGLTKPLCEHIKNEFMPLENMELTDIRLTKLIYNSWKDKDINSIILIQSDETLLRVLLNLEKVDKSSFFGKFNKDGTNESQ